MPKLTTSDLVLRDPITGVHSRVALPTRLEAEIQEARRLKTSVALLMVHLSFPKSAGPLPERIRGVAFTSFVKQIENITSTGDKLFKLSGSDFALVLSATSGDRATGIARKVLSALHGVPLKGDLPFALSLSIGVASFPADAQGHEALLAIARSRVHEARRRGHGRVVAHDSEEEKPLATKRLGPLSPPPPPPEPSLPDIYSERTPYNLPAMSKELLGRGRELAELFKSLDARPLTSIVGADGTGKTQLALAVAHKCASKYAHGVYYVDLQHAATAEQVVTAIGQTIRFPFTGFGQLATQLIGYLTDRHMLLVLDDFPSTPDALAFLQDILTAARGVRILATATKYLAVQTERFLDLRGLQLDEGEDDGEPHVRDKKGNWTGYLTEGEAQEEAGFFGGSDAMRLFVSVARRVNPGFLPSESDDQHIDSICRMLEGVPLAIELVAPWTLVLTCEALAEELGRVASQHKDRLDGATTEEAAVRLALDCSWAFQPEERRSALARLSVFKSGFSERAATRVASLTQAQVVGLVEKALVRRTPNGRFSLHPAVRRYAGEKLHASPKLESSVRERHALYYLNTLRGLQPKLINGTGAALEGILDEIAGEIWNVRDAWDWAVTNTLEEAIGEALESFCTFYERKGLFAEAERELDRAAESLRQNKEGRDEVLGCVLTRQARMRTYLGRYEQAGNLLQEALVYLMALHAPQETARALRGLGEVAYLLGKYDEAVQFAEEARFVCGEIEDGGSIWTTTPTLSIHDLTSTP